MYLEIKPIEALRHAELPQVAAPWYAIGWLKNAQSGLCRVGGFNDAWEACIHELDPHRDHWNHRAHGFERLCAKIKQGDWVVVLDKSWPPLAPAYALVNGQWQITQHVWEPGLRRRLESQIQTLQRQQREQEALQSRNRPPSAEVQTEPASGPGNRAATLGPHTDGEKVSSTNKASSANSGNSKANIHSQEQANSCVVASSRNMIEQKTGKDIPESELRDQMKAIMNKPDHDFEKDGINPVHAQALLKKHGVESELKTGLSLNDLEAETLKTPVMVGFKNPGHRVILDSVGRNAAGEAVFNVHDPAPSFSGKPRAMSESEFSKKYNDKAVVIVPK